MTKDVSVLQAFHCLLHVKINKSGLLFVDGWSRPARTEPFAHLALGLHLLGNVIKDLGPGGPQAPGRPGDSRGTGLLESCMQSSVVGAKRGKCSFGARGFHRKLLEVKTFAKHQGGLGCYMGREAAPMCDSSSWIPGIS